MPMPHAVRHPTRRARDPRPRARPARRRHLRDDAADDAAGGRPGGRSAAAAVVRHRRPRRLRRPAERRSTCWLMRAPRPQRARTGAALAVSALGTVVGFPLFLALALRQVDAMHAAVVTGVLPLATAVVAAIVLAPAAVGRLLGLRRARLRRWCSASPPGRAAARWSLADGLLLLAGRQRRDRLRRRRAAVGDDAGRAA